MAKVQIKSDKITPFGGIFSVMDAFTRILAPVIDQSLGMRSTTVGYQYSEIIRSLLCVYLCGGSCVEDISNHLMPHLKLHPGLRTCSADTILRALKELSEDNILYSSDKGKDYAFNACIRMNLLILDALMATRQLRDGVGYTLDFDHQFIETEKYDAKPTYKKFSGYGPGVFVIDDKIVGIENRDGNANVRFHQQDTLERMFQRLEAKGIKIQRFRADCGSCSREIVEKVEQHCDLFYIRANRCGAFYNDMIALHGWKKVEVSGLPCEINSMLVEKWEGKAHRLIVQRLRRSDPQTDIWEGEYTYRCILTNDYKSTPLEIIEFYNLRGGKERIFDDMNNGFGWSRLPKSFMNENAVFMLITALVRNFYLLLMTDKHIKDFELKPTSRVKAFVFRYISVAAKWVYMARQHVLNIYTDNTAYTYIFQFDFG